MNTDAMKSRKVDGWIDVNKELPNDGQCVLVKREGGKMDIMLSKYSTSKMPYGFECDATQAGIVTHWKPQVYNGKANRRQPTTKQKGK